MLILYTLMTVTQLSEFWIISDLIWIFLHKKTKLVWPCVSTWPGIKDNDRKRCSPPFSDGCPPCSPALLPVGVSASLWTEGQLAPGLAASQSENSLSFWSARLALRAQSPCYVWTLLRHGNITWYHWKSENLHAVCVCVCVRYMPAYASIA